MERRSLAKTVATVGGAQLPPHVSIMGNRFTLVDGAGNRRPLQSLSLDCVILDMNEKMSRMYYGDDRAYDPDDPQPPRCFSDNGIAPSVRSQEPQAASCQPDATGTKGCRWSVWGSATSKMTGDKIPACQNGLKLGLMVVKPGKKGKEKDGDDWIAALPGDNSGMVFFLRVPPASLTAAANYGKSIAGMSKLTIPWTGEEVPCDLNYVVTRISFVDGATGKLAFEAIGYIGEQIDNVINDIDQEKVDLAIGRGDQPIAALPAPEKKETKAEPTAKPLAKPQVSSEKRPRGRPPGSKNEPAAVVGPQFKDPEGIKILTSQTIRDEREAREAKAARREQEAREAAQAGMVDEAPEPPDSENPALDEFMNMDLK